MFALLSSENWGGIIFGWGWIIFSIRAGLFSIWAGLFSIRAGLFFLGLDDLLLGLDYFLHKDWRLWFDASGVGMLSFLWLKQVGPWFMLMCWRQSFLFKTKDIKYIKRPDEPGLGKFKLLLFIGGELIFQSKLCCLTRSPRGVIEKLICCWKRIGSQVGK